MKDERKTKAQLIEELAAMRQQAAETETVPSASVRRIRQALWKMHGVEGIHDLLQVLSQELKRSVAAIAACSVQVVREEKGEEVSYHIAESPAHETYAGPLAGTAVEECWREQRCIYRPDLRENDPYDEATQIWDEGLGYDAEVRSVLDVPFQQGTLAVNSTQPDAFADEDVVFIQEVAGVLSEGFQRMGDLLSLEQHRGELAERDRLLAAFHQVGLVAQQTLETRPMLSELSRQVVAAGMFRSLMVALVDEEHRRIEVAGNFQCKRDADGNPVPGSGVFSEPDEVGTSLSLDVANITAEVARSGELAVIDGPDERTPCT
jgi:hypothetical protein